MAEQDSESHVFALPEFWQTSQWLDQLNQDIGPSFFSQDLDHALQSNPSSLVTLAHTKIPDKGFFRQPSLKLSRETPNASDDDAPNLSCAGPPTETDVESLSDVWLELKGSSSSAPGFQTWESFLTRLTSSYQPIFLSEAGPATYDALLSGSSDPLRLRETDVPIVETKAYFASLLSLALGRESILFTKVEQDLYFKPALPRMRISGYSRHVLEGLEEQCLSCGTIFLELRSFAQSTYTKQSSRCRVAFASAVEQVLRIVQEHVLVHARSPRSLLQLQSTITTVKAILVPFQATVSKLERRTTDQGLISLVFDQASSAEHDEGFVHDMMREILQKVSRPWIEFLEEWVGTRKEEGVPLSKSDLGKSKGFVKVEAQVYVDDSGEEVEEIDFRLDESSLPNFFSEALAKSMFETGRNLRFIRSSHPDHPLAQPNAIEFHQPPHAAWLYDWQAISRLEGRLAKYQENLLASLQQSQAYNEREMKSESWPEAPLPYGLAVFGLGEDDIEANLLASIDQFSHVSVGRGTDDSLGRIVRERLRGIYVPSDSHGNSTPHWSLLPSLSFGSIISTQGRIINRESLRLLFKAHGLRGHLRLHRDFHLLGSGNFCSRLSHALFDPDLESAEREAGVARQGGIMGLRLGGRETWPPASSELRLALMGVLAEAYDTQHDLRPQSLDATSKASSDLPGDLSFAVRDLSEEEISKCLNADSLEALDFLRLSYSAPSELASIITPRALSQYDRIFKHLLRVLRMLYVVNQTFRDISSRDSLWDEPTSTSFRFGIEARHFVSSISAYFMDTGVKVPWQAFETKLDELEAQVEHGTAGDALNGSVSPSQAEAHHNHLLDLITTTLFLRKRQQPVLKLLEDIFNIILLYAKYSRLQALGGSIDKGPQQPLELYKRFKQKVQIFVTVCRGLTEKSTVGQKRAAAEGALNPEGIGEESTVAHLLVKLDMYEYYAKR